VWFAVRREMLERLLEDKEWRDRFESAKTTSEAQQVMEQFVKKEGFKVKEIKPRSHIFCGYSHLNAEG